MTNVSNDPFSLKAGDTGPAIVCTIRDGDGELVDIDNPTFVMDDMDGNNVIDATATRVSEGVYSYSWQDGDTADAGDYKAKFEGTIDGKRYSFPNGRSAINLNGYIPIRIDPDIGD